MHIDFPKWFEDLISVSSGLFTVLGFSVVGFFIVSKRVMLLLARFVFQWRDRRKLGPAYIKLLALAQRDHSFDPSTARSLAKYVKTVEDELRQSIRECLKDRNETILSLHASGSTRLRYSDILRRDGLLMPLSFRDELTKEPQSIGSLVEDLSRKMPEIRAPMRARYLIIGDAGTGKSLSTIFLEVTINNQPVSAAPWLFGLKADDFFRLDQQRVHVPVGRGDIGSLSWCVEILATRMELRETSELQRHLLTAILERDALIVLDGLDEIVQRLGRHAGERLLSSWLFQHADVICCRTGFYYASLLGIAAMSELRVLSVRTPDTTDRARFLNAACTAIHGASGWQVLASIEQALREQPAIASLVQTPLLLLMLIEVTDPAETLAASDSVGIYEAFLNKTLRRDSSRVAATWTAEVVSDILCELAWAVIVDVQAERRGILRIDRAAVREAIRKHAATIDLETLTALEEGILGSPIFHTTRELASLNHYTVRFSHESFGEFLVAMKLYNWLLGKADGGEEFFDVLETPAISHFIKEYIARLRLLGPNQAGACQRLDDLLNKQLLMRRESRSERSARLGTFSAGQVAYYLGMLASPTHRTRIEDLASSHEDFWIRRAAAIGLAFGGHVSQADGLIDSMWADMAKGDFRNARRNIAIELGFYGDQEFDRLDPTRDQGGTKCERALTQIVRQLDSLVESPNWRMDLFDVLYLAKHRPESKDDYDRVCKALRPRFGAWLESARSNSRLTRYPEVAKLATLLGHEHEFGSNACVGS